MVISTHATDPSDPAVITKEVKIKSYQSKEIQNYSYSICHGSISTISTEADTYTPSLSLYLIHTNVNVSFTRASCTVHTSSPRRLPADEAQAGNRRWRPPPPPPPPPEDCCGDSGARLLPRGAALLAPACREPAPLAGGALVALDFAADEEAEA